MQPALLNLAVPQLGETNIAAVPHLSLFRYPGGKTWFVPWLQNWLKQNEIKTTIFLEAFAGGASCGLSVAINQLAEQVILVERDSDVAAVWKVVFGKSNTNRQRLKDSIANFQVTRDSVLKLLNSEPVDLVDKAFQTIIRNRVNQGGILAPSAGMLNGGENGRGLSSRWYPQTLIDRINLLESIRDKVKFVQGNGMYQMKKYQEDVDTTVFIDPPYTAGGKKAGERLYKYNKINHPKLFEQASNMKGVVIMTYDDTEEVRKLAKTHGFYLETVPMKSNRHERKLELVLTKRIT